MSQLLVGFAFFAVCAVVSFFLAVGVCLVLVVFLRLGFGLLRVRWFLLVFSLVGVSWWPTPAIIRIYYIAFVSFPDAPVGVPE